ncbi:2TM domain-containing protein [Bergeyella porcorum]|uniref:2TM domain-containing protein n=1 Tax=Bergeyella porcorum TaxID=1735111 RepID=UPI0035F0F85D
MEANYEQAYKEARERVKKLKSFYRHLMMYVIVNVFLVALNLYQNPDNLWCLWVIFSWGFGLAMNAISVFVPELLFGKDWEERKTKELMDKYHSKNR